jgi:hypothetical protein
MSVLNANGRIHQITTSHFLPHPCWFIGSPIIQRYIL